MTTAFEHAHATVQAVNLQCIAHGGDGFILEITTDKGDDKGVGAGYVAVQVLKGGYNRRRDTDDPKAEGRTLESACDMLLLTEQWKRWVNMLQRKRADAITDEEKSRRESLVKHDARLTTLRELPTFTTTADGEAPADPEVPKGTTRYDVIASDDDEDEEDESAPSGV